MARILIVEDESDIAALYRVTLEERGHEVLGTYDDPRIPLARAAELQDGRAPHLILLDERLGPLSGTSFIGDLLEAFPGAKIIVVSADPDAAELAQTHGAHDVLRKPVTLDRLAKNVDLAVGVV